MLGKRIGNYHVVRQIDKGGMGAVFEAVHESIGKHVAIKVLHSHFSQDPQIAKRFFNEARAVTSIGHPGIVQVFDFGQMEGGPPYIVMEFLAGESLGRRLKRSGQQQVVPALRLARQMASALAAAHAHKVVHRDLKPGNVIIVPDPETVGGERAKILDFGIAKMMEECNNPEPEATEFKTRTGMLIGTPTYMSPEQCRGAGRVDDRTDVYALGVILYQMLSGRPPFIAEGDGEVMAMHIYETPVPLRERNPAVPADVVEMIQQMLHKSPAQRPAMTEVALGLEGLQIKLSGAVSAVFALPASAQSGQGRALLPLTPAPQSRISQQGVGSVVNETDAEPDSYASISVTPTPAAARGPSSTASRHGSGERVDQPQRPRRKRGLFLWFSLAAVLLLSGVMMGSMIYPGLVLPPDPGRPTPSPLLALGAGSNRAPAVPAVSVTPLTTEPPAPQVAAPPAPQEEPAPEPAPLAQKKRPRRPSHVEAEGESGDAADMAHPAEHAVPAVNPPPVPPATHPPEAPAGPPRIVPAFVIRKDKLGGDMPHLPEWLRSQRHNNPARGSYKICIGPSGHVSSVTAISSIAGADEPIMATLRGWTYKPTAVPFCFVETFDFQ